MKESGDVFRRRNSKYWYFYYYQGNKRIAKSTKETVKKYARQAKEAFFEKMENPKSNIQLEQFANDFFVWEKCSWIRRRHNKGHGFSEPVARSRRGHLENYIFPAFGKYSLSRISTKDADDWLEDLPLSNQTRNHILYTFRIVMEEARRGKYININPIKECEPYGKDARKRSIFTPEDYQLLFPHDAERFLIKELLEIWGNLKIATSFVVLADSGIRSGELRALTWENYLEDKSALWISRAVKENNTIAQTKTGNSRPVWASKRTMGLLGLWREKTPYCDPGDLIFFGTGGPQVPIARKTLCNRFTAALNRAQIDRSGRWLTAHSFRHSYNTYYRSRIPEEQLRILTGHKTPSMTNLYDNPRIEDMLQRIKGTREVIEGVWQ